MSLAASLHAGEPAFPDPASLPVVASLPDPLLGSNGQRVENSEQWLTKRAPELRALFQHYEYGQFPAPTKVEARVMREDKAALGGKATLREIELSLAHPEGAQIHLLLVTPNEAKGPAPVFLGLNFDGNHALLPARARPWNKREARRSTCGRWINRSRAVTRWRRFGTAKSCRMTRTRPRRC
jgi:hypothetical protein